MRNRPETRARALVRNGTEHSTRARPTQRAERIVGDLAARYEQLG